MEQHSGKYTVEAALTITVPAVLYYFSIKLHFPICPRLVSPIGGTRRDLVLIENVDKCSALVTAWRHTCKYTVEPVLTTYLLAALYI